MNSGYQTCAEYDTDPRNAVSFLLFTDFYVPTTGRAFVSHDAYLIARIIWMKMRVVKQEVNERQFCSTANYPAAQLAVYSTHKQN